MKTIRNLLPVATDKLNIGKVALLTLLLCGGPVGLATEAPKQNLPARDQSRIITGSGKDYQTTVERQTQGVLSDQDLHQASLLTSRVVKHLNDAVQGLLDQNTAAAKADIEKAQTLIKVVRNLLPITTATTIVKDAGGREVYRDVDRVQDDRIALYDGMIAMEVVEPLVDARKNEAALKGLRLADANVLHTSVLADLGYIERKLDRAAALMDKPADALAQLTLAQTHGVEFVVNEADSPLVKVQQALHLAERMVEEGKYEAARDNLRLAQLQLGTYRALLGPEAGKTVKQLEDDINALLAKTEEKGAAENIRGYWERTVKLFREELSQAHSVSNTPPPETKQPVRAQP